MKLNLYRIKSLMVKDWDERKMHYLRVWLVYFGVMAVVFTWCALMYVHDAVSDGYYAVSSAQDEIWSSSDVIYPFYILFLFLAVSSRGSDFMSGATDRQGLQTHLSLPASTEEKILVRWIFTVPFTYLMFYSAFFAADLVRILVCSSVYPDLQIFHLPGSEVLNGKFLLLSLTVQSLFILGSTLNGFIKTATLFVGCVMLWMAFRLMAFETVIARPAWMEHAFYWFLGGGLAGAYLLTYWRFREMRLAYAGMRNSTKVVLVLLVFGLLIGLMCFLMYSKLLAIS